jgi:acyl-CoA synthetase (AMP-forming)/AMP-acid ligase II
MADAPDRAPTRIHHLMDPWVAEQPDAPALRDVFVALSYRELRDASVAAARQLRALGLRAGDRLLVVGENCVALGLWVLAASRLDAWIVVTNARLSEREIDLFIEHAQPRRVLYTPHVSPEAARHAARHGAENLDCPGLGQIPVGALNEGARTEACFDNPREQVGCVLYTSGTSGAPKGVMLTHANMMFTATSAARMRGMTRDDLSYGVLPMAHIVGLTAQFMGNLSAGSSLVLAPRFTPAETARMLRDEGITIFTGVPAMMAKMLDWSRETNTPLTAPRLRLMTVAGSPMTPALKHDAEQVFGLPLDNGYGLTECAPTIAQTRVGERRSDCAVGHPIPGVEVRIVAADGAAVPQGGIGELWVRTPGLMKGYYRSPDLTAQVIDAEGWFNTGDMVRMEPDGALTIVGRSKELIIRSGLNVYPVEVEQALNAHPEVIQSAVVGRTVEHNEEVVAFVERAAGSRLDEAALRAHLRACLAPYKIPSEIRFISPLPAAPTGKLLKGVMKTMAQQPADAYPAPAMP